MQEMKQLGVPVHSVREGGELPDLVVNVFASLAQEESRVTGARISAAFLHFSEHGWHVGSAPWGYYRRPATPEERAAGSPRKVIDLDAVMAPIVRETFMRIAGGAQVADVCRWLATVPAMVESSRDISFSSIVTKLERATYVGAGHPTATPMCCGRSGGGPRWWTTERGC